MCERLSVPKNACVGETVTAQLHVSPYLNAVLSEEEQINEPSCINKFGPMLEAIWFHRVAYKSLCVHTCKNSHLENAAKFVQFFKGPLHTETTRTEVNKCLIAPMWLQISMHNVEAQGYQSTGKKVLRSPGLHPFPCTKPWVHVQSCLWLCVLRQELLVVMPRSPNPQPIQIRRANGWKRGRGNCYIHL